MKRRIDGTPRARRGCARRRRASPASGSAASAPTVISSDEEDVEETIARDVVAEVSDEDSEDGIVPNLVTDSDNEEESLDSRSTVVDSDSDINFGKMNDPVDMDGWMDPVEGPPRVTPKRHTVLPNAHITDETLPETGFDKEAVATMMALGVPRLVYYVLAILHWRTEFSNETDLDAVDFFSGKGQVTRNFKKRGLRAKSFDILDNAKYEDMNGIWGFCTALQYCRRLCPTTGILWLGTVCSTWIFLSRDSTMRTDTDARGDVSRRCVRAGNKQAARSALILVIAFARKLAFVLEQPGSSLLFKHPAMLFVGRRAVHLGFLWHIVETYMWHFQAPHVKRTALLSNESFTHSLARPHPGSAANQNIQRTASTRVRADGKKQCSGDRTGVLKGTQTYTAAFGQAVADAFLDLRHFFGELQCTAGQLDDPVDYEADMWEDLDIEPLFQALNEKFRFAH